MIWEFTGLVKQTLESEFSDFITWTIDWICHLFLCPLFLVFFFLPSLLPLSSFLFFLPFYPYILFPLLFFPLVHSLSFHVSYLFVLPSFNPGFHLFSFSVSCTFLPDFLFPGILAFVPFSFAFFLSLLVHSVHPCVFLSFSSLLLMSHHYSSSEEAKCPFAF